MKFSTAYPGQVIRSINVEWKHSLLCYIHPLDYIENWGGGGGQHNDKRDDWLGTLQPP